MSIIWCPWEWQWKFHTPQMFCLVIDWLIPTPLLSSCETNEERAYLAVCLGRVVHQQHPRCPGGSFIHSFTESSQSFPSSWLHSFPLWNFELYQYHEKRNSLVVQITISFAVQLYWVNTKVRSRFYVSSDIGNVFLKWFTCFSPTAHQSCHKLIYSGGMRQKLSRPEFEPVCHKLSQ